MSKIVLDKYYTPQQYSTQLVELATQWIDMNTVDTIIEPSAGNGSILDVLYSTKDTSSKHIYAYDIAPERDDIKQADFLTSSHNYSDKTLVITNPPYGRVNNLTRAFIKKACQIAKHVVMLIPATFHNRQGAIKYKLLKSEYCGMIQYPTTQINSTINYYVSELHNIPRYRSDIVVVDKRTSKQGTLQRNNTINESDYDIGICAWGTSVGKILKRSGEYCLELWIKGCKRHIDYVMDRKSLLEYLRVHSTHKCAGMSIQMMHDYIIWMETNSQV